MGQEIDLYLDTSMSFEAVRAMLARDPAVRVSDEGVLYAHALNVIQVNDMRKPSSDDDSYRKQYGFGPTVNISAQLTRSIDSDSDGGLPGMNTFLAIAGRLLATVPGDAAMVQNSDYVFLYRRAGVVTVIRDWLTDANRRHLALPHRLADFTHTAGPDALAVADAP